MAVNAFPGLACFVQPCITRRISGFSAVVRLVGNFKRIGLLVFLLVAIPAQGRAGGFHEIREAVDLWYRVFGPLPALEQFIREGKRPRDPDHQALETAVEGLSQQEAANPFLPVARGALFFLTKKGSVSAEATKASRLAGDRVAVRWLIRKALLRFREDEAADRELREIREIRDRLGLDRIGYLGFDLATTAEALAGRGNLEEAERALTLASEFDPGAPQVLFTQARIHFGRGSPLGVFPLMTGWWVSLTSPVYGLSHWANILASFLFAVPVILSVVGLVFLLRVTRLFGHDLAEWRRRRVSPGTEALLPIPFYLLPVIAGFGFLPSLLLSLLPLGIYLKVRERLLWAALILSLLLLPRGYGLLGRMMTVTTSSPYVSVVEVEEGNRGRDAEAALLRWVGEASNDAIPRFYLGRVYRSRGELREGIETYAAIREGGVLGAAVWNNQGNLAFLAGDLDRAQTAYEKAKALNPDFSYPRFNLSQLLTDRLLLEDAQQEYARAIRENPTLERRMKQAVADGRKQVIIDAPIPGNVLWHRVLHLGSPSPEMAEILWGGRFLGISLAHLPWMVGGYLVAFGGILWLRKRRRFARACQDCGKVFCPRCQRLLGEIRLCTRCALIERMRAGEMPSTIKTIPADEAQREARWLGWLFALIPGSEGLYRGKVVWGLVLIAVTLFVLSPLLGAHLAPEIYLPGVSLPYHLHVSILFLGCLYLLIIVKYTKSRGARVKERRWR